MVHSTDQRCGVYALTNIVRAIDGEWRQNDFTEMRRVRAWMYKCILEMRASTARDSLTTVSEEVDEPQVTGEGGATAESQADTCPTVDREGGERQGSRSVTKASARDSQGREEQGKNPDTGGLVSTLIAGAAASMKQVAAAVREGMETVFGGKVGRGLKEEKAL